MNKNVLFLRKKKKSNYCNKNLLSSKVENTKNFLYIETLIKISIFSYMTQWGNTEIHLLWKTFIVFDNCWQQKKKKKAIRDKSTSNIPLSGPYWYDETLRLWHSCRCRQHPLFQPYPAWYRSQCNSQFVQHQHWKKFNKSKELQDVCSCNLIK